MAYVRQKGYPCIRCKTQIPKTGVAAIQCSVCELWLHKQCPGKESEVSEDLYVALNTQKTLSGGAYWSCNSCRSSHAKLNARVVVLDKAVDGLQKKVLTYEREIEALKKEVAAIKQDAKEASAKGKPDAVKETVTGAVFKEIRERDAKRHNVVVQGLTEAPRAVTDGKARRDVDIAKLQDMLNVLELDIDASRNVRSATRLGRIGGDARPLLVLFRNPDDQAAVLDHAKKLNTADAWKGVRVLQDLTRIQRQEEKLLRQEADELAAQLTDDEAKNWMFRVVGRRGARRVAKVPLSTVAERADATRRPRPTRQRTNARASPARAAQAVTSPPAAMTPPPAAMTPPPAATTMQPVTTPRRVATSPETTPAAVQIDEEGSWTPVLGRTGGRRSARVQTRAQATTTAVVQAAVTTLRGQAMPAYRGGSNRGQAPPAARGKSKRGQ